MKLFGSSKDITYPWLSYCFKQSKLLRLMKITAFLLTVFSLQVSAKGHAQTITLSLKNEPIQKAFKQIESQAGYTFIYTKNMIANSKPVTFVAKDETLEKVLKLCFNDQPFVYTIMDKYIVIKQKSIPAVNDVEGAGSTLSNFELHGGLMMNLASLLSGLPLPKRELKILLSRMMMENLYLPMYQKMR